jgi:hypothetical protein
MQRVQDTFAADELDRVPKAARSAAAIRASFGSARAGAVVHMTGSVVEKRRPTRGGSEPIRNRPLLSATIP